MLSWSKYDFIECLGVVPEEAEDGSFLFRVVRDGLRLDVTVFPHEGLVEPGGDIYIDLYREGADEPLFFTKIQQSPAARYVKYPSGWECLEIAAPCRGVHFGAGWAVPMGARVKVNPTVSVEMFQPPGDRHRI
jgi:hypothetical protein